MIPVARQNLLIVDDEPAQLQTLADILTDEGFDVTTCSTIEDALDQCESHVFAVAILDLRLGGQDGIDLLQKVRRSQPKIRTIIHTGYGSFDSAKDAVNLGAFAYVEKRGDPTELLSEVHRAVKDLLTEALAQSEQRIRQLLDHVGAIVWECELPSWQFTFVSQQAETILGYPVSRWLEDPDFRVNHTHPDERDRLVNLCQKCAERGEDYEFDYRVIAADGRLVWLRDIVRVLKDQNEKPIRLRGVMIDITEKKRAEEQLQEMEAKLAHVSRLSTLGEMVAGIAHEINQPLTAISNYAAACSNSFASIENNTDFPIETWLTYISQEAMRCGEIIRGLRGFVNKSEQQWEWVHLDEAIRESIALITSDKQNRAVVIEYGFADQETRVCGNKVQIQQVLVNLLKNACDATRENAKPVIHVQTEVREEGVRVTVEDNGAGIEVDRREKLFDAFFTTKPDGMGIGLAISKSIIEAHHGTLRLDSDTKTGAKFQIDLPLRELARNREIR